MNSSRNSRGYRTNQLAAKRLQWYQGCGIIGFQNLKFESESVVGGRLLDERNVDRIFKIFEIEGCGNFEPEHCIAALVDQQTLSDALQQSDLSRESLLDPTSQPRLSFADGCQLICVFGRHRIQAAIAFGVKDWLVDLYLEEIPPEPLLQLREESSKSLEFSDGEIYRTLRLYQISHNKDQARKWWARFPSEGRRRDIRRLQQDEHLLDGLDRLLPFVGMWKSLKTTQIERILALRSPEIICHYIDNIYQRWSHIIQNSAAAFVDPLSVHLLEGLMPETCLEDKNRIMDLVQSDQLFPLLVDASDREAMLDRLLSTPGRIISLHTLAQDTLFLDEPARALRCLCPKIKRTSFQNVMLRQWKVIGTGGSIEVQETEHSFIPAQRTDKTFFLCFMQLWLFAIRHFTHQRPCSKATRREFEWSTEDISMRKLAVLAARLGFDSIQIKDLRSDNPTRKIAKGFIESLCREDFYDIQDRRIQSMSKQLHSFLRNLPKSTDGTVTPVQFTTNDPLEAAANRFNKPVRDQYDQQRKYLFLPQISGDNKAVAQYPTPIGVTRDILSCFFGNENLGLTSPQPKQRIASAGDRVRPPVTSEIPSSRQSSISIHSTTPNPEAIVTNQTDNLVSVPLSPSSSRYSRGVDFSSMALDGPSEPVEMEPYPSGTPDPPPPLAAGFEDPCSNGPMEIKNYISVHRKVAEILRIWLQSQKEVIVLFLFESRAYYKFNVAGGFKLRSIIRDLSREHIFLVLNEFSLGSPDINATYEEALEQRLLLVSKRDSPAQSKDEEGLISLDRLRDYVLSYDIRTGKRKRDLNDQTGQRYKIAGRD